jgi:CheY-like chemotaxis protein
VLETAPPNPIGPIQPAHILETPQTGELSLSEIGILIFDNDEESQRTLRLVLDSEGWLVRVVPDISQAMAELASTSWSLVLANVALVGLQGVLFSTLKELSQAPLKPASEPAVGAAPVPNRQLRVLFLVPQLDAPSVVPALERDRLAYTVLPYHMHDFLEKIDELLVESGAIATPTRGLTPSFADRKVAPKADARNSSMFASRADYHMTEEDLAEYERVEKQETEQRKASRLKKRELL